jgi:hypothetical protein
MKIVTGLLKRHPEIRITPKEIREEAQKWQMSHGFLSGRSAEQFVNYLAGTWKKKRYRTANPLCSKHFQQRFLKKGRTKWIYYCSRLIVIL